MFIIWGSRWRKTQEGETEQNCVFCENNNLRIYAMRRWFTLFFIPIFPTSSKKIHFECPTCQNCYVLKKGINDDDRY